MVTPVQAIPRRSRGFTVLEVMVATAVSGVLASIAYPSASAALQKARRSEALVAMMQIQVAEERWRADSSRYAMLDELRLQSVTAGGHYHLDISVPDAQGYIALAEATGAQAGDRPCRFLKLTLAEGVSVYASGETQATSNDATANRRCWAL
jgi:type IV pilus assembly protein PilE